MEIASWFPLHPSPTHLPNSWFTHTQQTCNFPLFSCQRKLPAVSFLIFWNYFAVVSVLTAGSPREEYERCLLHDITPPNYNLGLNLIPARVLIVKAKQIPNKHSSKGLVSKDSLTAFLVGVTPCWHLAGAFHDFWTWVLFTSLEPISAENKSPVSVGIHIHAS